MATLVRHLTNYLVVHDVDTAEQTTLTCFIAKLSYTNGSSGKRPPAKLFKKVLFVPSISIIMAGIPVYTQSPITAANPDGITPQTAAQPAPTNPSLRTYNAATTTATPTSTYSSAQPGAPAMPAPTSTAANRYAPVQPTPTTKPSTDDPPPPQPGAVPIAQNSFTARVPPPPRSGEQYQPPTVTQSQPPQMSIPPPTNIYGAQPPSSSTAISTNPSFSYPVHLPVGTNSAPRRSIDHPPGSP